MKQSTGNRRLVVIVCGRKAIGPVLVKSLGALTAIRVPSVPKKPNMPSGSDELPPAA